MKPGWKTSEFWQTGSAQILAFLTFAGVISSNDTQTLEEALGKSVAAVFTLIVNGMIVANYVKTRFHLKAISTDTTKTMTVLLLLCGFGCFLVGSPVQAQVLPWRQGITQQLRNHENKLNNLKNTPAPSPAPQIIVMPPANPPLQSFPIAGGPLQQIPIQGQPQQSFPIQGQPKQDLPIQGQPKQDLPIPGPPQQQFPIQGTPQPIPVAPQNQSGPQAYSRQYALHKPL